MTRKSFLITAASALMALCLPVLASAQGGYDNRNYDNRALRDAIHRLRDDSHRLQDDLDRALDHSRANGSRREDNINSLAREFRSATDDLKNRFGDGRDPYRSQSDAQRVLDLGNQLSRVIRRGYNDQRVANDWAQVSSELSYIADAFGYRGNYNNGGYYPDNNQRRNDDDYRRRERNRRIADEIFRRFPN